MMPAVTVDAKETGDWDGLLEFLNGGAPFKALTKRLKRAITQKLAEEYVTKVKAAIEAGDVGGPPLSAATEAAKGHGTAWINNTDLVNSITHWEHLNGTFKAGVPAGAVNRKGQSLDLIALILEIGSYNIPARPVFGPVAELMNATSGSDVNIIIEREMKSL